MIHCINTIWWYIHDILYMIYDMTWCDMYLICTCVLSILWSHTHTQLQPFTIVSFTSSLSLPWMHIQVPSTRMHTSQDETAGTSKSHDWVVLPPLDPNNIIYKHISGYFWRKQELVFFEGCQAVCGEPVSFWNGVWKCLEPIWMTSQNQRTKKTKSKEV